MLPLHENDIGRTQRLLGYALSLLPSLGVLGSGITKFIPGNDIHLLLEALDIADHAIVIGLIEIAVVVLYWIPRTCNLGFFLFCTYVGAILMAEIMLGDFPLPALAIGAMIVSGTLLRKPSLLGWGRANRVL